MTANLKTQIEAGGRECVFRELCVRMISMQWWAPLVVVYLSMYLEASQQRRKALYPSAYRIKRGTYSLLNPMFQQTMEDVNLLFEILLAGMQIRDGDHALLIPDEELASLRSVEKLEVICDDVLPRRLSEIRHLTAELAKRRRRLSLQDFERTLLTLVYGAQTLASIRDQQQRQVWTESVLQLFRAIHKDLRPS